MDDTLERQDLVAATITESASSTREKSPPSKAPWSSSCSPSPSSTSSPSMSHSPPNSTLSDHTLLSDMKEHQQVNRTTTATSESINQQQVSNRARDGERELQKRELEEACSVRELRAMSLTTTATSSDQPGASCESFRVFKTLASVVCVDDFEQVAKFKLDKSIYDYYCQGSDDETTLNWNRSMISQRYCLKPRVMCNVAQVDLTKYIFGDRLSLPIGVSPTAMHRMAHPEGELAMVRACDRANCIMILSLFSTTSLENVAKEAPICTKWQNIYILKQRDITQNVINRAIRYGYRALVVTCDAPVLGNRRRDVRNQFTLGKFTLENIEDSSVQSMRDHSSDIFDPSVCWSDLADLKKSVGDTVRVIAKGIMTPEDAELALKAGVDAIFISNHGGRQLDGSPSTIEVLPDIVKVIKKQVPIFIDGGFRTGGDILKALALGADMVFLGRPPLWGLASYGEEGAFRALKMLEEELKKAMMLCGCTKLNDISSNMVFERAQ